MLGVTARPTQVEQMIMPPTAHGVRAISSGMLKKGNEPLPLRGPILHRLLQQFLADVFWGDLDVLLMDLPPGTGDVAISAAQLVPGSELIVVTTPQLAAAEVAERAGALASQLHQRVVGVIENMAYLPCPHCGERVEVFGTGGGQAVADTLTRIIGAPVPLMGEIPIDTRLRKAGDSGEPIVLSDPDSPAAMELRKIAQQLGEPVAQPGGPAARPVPGLVPPAVVPPYRAGSGGLDVIGRALARLQPDDRVLGHPRANASHPAVRDPGAAAVASVPFIAALASSSRCLRTKYFGFRSLRSNSLNSGPRCSCRSALAFSASRRTSRRARPACAASSGSWSGPKTTSAITASTAILKNDRSNNECSRSPAVRQGAPDDPLPGDNPSAGPAGTQDQLRSARIPAAASPVGLAVGQEVQPDGRRPARGPGSRPAASARWGWAGPRS